MWWQNSNILPSILHPRQNSPATAVFPTIQTWCVLVRTQFLPPPRVCFTIPLLSSLVALSGMFTCPTLTVSHPTDGCTGITAQALAVYPLPPPSLVILVWIPRYVDSFFLFTSKRSLTVHSEYLICHSFLRFVCYGVQKLTLTAPS